MNSHGSAFTVVGACIFACGCLQSSLEEESEHVNTGEHAIESKNRLTMNGLSSNRLTINGLSTGSLTQDGSTLVQTDLITDEPGRELLTYVARCALTPTQTLVGTHQGVTYTFPGVIGLTPSWLSSPLADVRKQRWVSACLLAHVNGHGVEVPISMRGSHSALYASDAEKAAFTMQEAAFFGNVFAVHPGDDLLDIDIDIDIDIGDDDDDGPSTDPGTAVPLKSYACGGEQLRTQCTGSGSLRPQRSCGENEPCALVFPGVCKAPSGQSGNACKSTSPGGGFMDCHSTLTNASGQWGSNSQEYEEIITVYLQPSDFNSLYLTCTPVAQ